MTELDGLSKRSIKRAVKRFNSMAFDEETQALRHEFKDFMAKAAAYADTHLEPGRARSLVITKLEEAMMWFGKGCRKVQRLKDDPK